MKNQPPNKGANQTKKNSWPKEETKYSENVSELLDYSQLAKITRKSVGTLRRYKLLGIGPTYLRIGRHVRFRREDVLAWLESCAHGGQINRPNTDFFRANG